MKDFNDFFDKLIFCYGSRDILHFVHPELFTEALQKYSAVYLAVEDETETINTSNKEIDMMISINSINAWEYTNSIILIDNPQMSNVDKIIKFKKKYPKNIVMFSKKCALLHETQLNNIDYVFFPLNKISSIYNKDKDEDSNVMMSIRFKYYINDEVFNELIKTKYQTSNSNDYNNICAIDYKSNNKIIIKLNDIKTIKFKNISDSNEICDLNKLIQNVEVVINNEHGYTDIGLIDPDMADVKLYI
jgi:hypothetical protein